MWPAPDQTATASQYIPKGFNHSAQRCRDVGTATLGHEPHYEINAEGVESIWGAGHIAFGALKWVRICVHLCSSVVKVSFNYMVNSARYLRILRWPLLQFV
jgi:hypothetical protein